MTYIQEQCPIVNSDIKGPLKIDLEREISLKKECCDTETTALQLTE